MDAYIYEAHEEHPEGIESGLLNLCGVHIAGWP